MTPTAEVFVRTAAPPQVSARAATWSIALEGGRGPARVSIDELRAASRPMGSHLIECAGNNNPDNFGLLSVADWSGVPLEEVVRSAWRTRQFLWRADLGRGRRVAAGADIAARGELGAVVEPTSQHDSRFSPCA